MQPSMHYEITMTAGALVSSLGQVATTANTSWTLRIAAEVSPPVLRTTTPVAGASSVAERTDAVFEFDKYVAIADRCQQAGDCSVSVATCTPACSATASYPLLAGVHDRVSSSIPSTGGVRLVPDAKQLTVYTGVQPLSSSTRYRIAIPNGTLADASGNDFNGTALYFTTGDFSPPELRAVTTTQPLAGGNVFATLQYDAGEVLQAVR